MRWRKRSTANEIAERSVARARRLLKAQDADLIASVFHYGAVDIDAAHLVVWVLLTSPPEAIPPWCFYPERPDGQSIAPDLRSKLIDIQALVRSCLAREEWPNAAHVSVGFDSAQRVDEGGGWYYFK
ncbi:MAG: hypothetical protein ABJB98_08510 [Actinomycetota bacterium]